MKRATESMTEVPAGVTPEDGGAEAMEVQGREEPELLFEEL